MAFNALVGLAVTSRDAGELAEADAALTQALEVCERAGLIGHSIHATCLRALVLAQSGEAELALEAAERAAALSERIHYPLGEAAVLEARGVTGELPDALEHLQQARAAWQRLGRPLEAARCELAVGRRLRESDPDAASSALKDAVADYERLGVAHLAGRARELMTV